MMKHVMIPDRWERIIQLVEESGGATVEQISQTLDISPATVRRDLARIQQRGLIKRTRGGAEPSEQVRVITTLAESRRINPAEKELIGRAAAELVQPGDIIMIDGGFTTYQVASFMTAPDLTVITNSLDVAQALVARNDVTVLVIGGELSAASGTNTGPVADEQIAHYWANWAILGADAISLTEGLTSPNPLTAETKKAMIKASHGLIIVADHSKLGRFSPHRIASCDQVDFLVTDYQADPELVEAFQAAGITVIVAGSADDLH